MAVQDKSQDPTLYYKAVGSIALYFITVLTALGICITRTRLNEAKNWVYLGIAISSLGITWFYIISWFQQEYRNLGSDLDRFIIESDLFVKAYAIVTNTLPKWWWSSQLLVATGTCITCWSVEGQSLRLDIEKSNTAIDVAASSSSSSSGSSKNATTINSTTQKKRTWTPTWWFVLLGFFGSMSVGGPLFLAQPDSTGQQKTRTAVRSVPWTLVILILLGEFSVLATPFFPSSTSFFTTNLMLTHAFFLVPTFFKFNPTIKSKYTTVALPHFYFLLALMALSSHLVYSLPFLYYPILPVSSLYQALWDNFCQTSISADMVINNLVAAVYMIQSSGQLINGGKKRMLAGVCIALMPILSFSTVLPLYLGWLERQQVIGGGSGRLGNRVEGVPAVGGKKKAKLA